MNPINHEASGYEFDVECANHLVSNHMFRILGGIGYSENQKKRKRKSKHSRSIHHTTHNFLDTCTSRPPLSSPHERFWVSVLHSRSQIPASTSGGASSTQLQGSRSPSFFVRSFARSFVCLQGFFRSFCLRFCCFYHGIGKIDVRSAEVWCRSKRGYFETGGSSMGCSY